MSTLSEFYTNRQRRYDYQNRAEWAALLDRRGKNRLTRLARREGARLGQVYEANEDTRRTNWFESRAARILKARADRNYAGMMQLISKKAIRQAGINV